MVECLHNKFAVHSDLIQMFDAMMALLVVPEQTEASFPLVVRGIQKKHQQYVTKRGESKVLASYYALVAKYLLLDDWPQARRTMQQALNLAFVLANGINGGKTTFGSDFTPYLAVFERVRSRSGLIREVSKRVPCDCLATKKRIIMRLPKTICCFQCYAELPQKSVSLCSGCYLATYCSKECQKANWRCEHQELCSQHRKLMMY